MHSESIYGPEFKPQEFSFLEESSLLTELVDKI